MSELSLNKIQTPTEAKLFRNFAYGSRAPKYKCFAFGYGVNKNFCSPRSKPGALLWGPLAKIFCAAFSILKFYSYNVCVYLMFCGA